MNNEELLEKILPVVNTFCLTGKKVTKPIVSQALDYFCVRKIVLPVANVDKSEVNFHFQYYPENFSDKHIPVNFRYAVENGEIVKKDLDEFYSDYVVTPITDMETLKKTTKTADDEFTPDEQEDRKELHKLVVSGDLIEKFN